MRDKPILCLDFDGVLHAYTSGWQGDGRVDDGPTEGAVDFLRLAVKRFRVAVFSSRSASIVGRDAMRRALREWIADESVFNKLEFPSCKPPALVSIDDRCITFTGVFPAIDTLLGFKPWVKGRDSDG